MNAHAADKLRYVCTFKYKLTAILTLLILFISCDSKAPVISSINPKVGRMGEIITIDGNHFGELEEDSFITIAGITPTASSYYLWQDNLIMVRVPELGESGLVYVHTKGKRSNGVLFSNIAAVPQPVEGGELGLGPRISSLDPQSGAPGTIITITGNNFGNSREGGGVFFSWDYEVPSYSQYMNREREFIEVSELELGYISWSAREITVRVPDGAIRGNIEVRTPGGRSPPVYFDVSVSSGRKNFTGKRSYTISYSVDIRVNEATRPNGLYLWIPRPVYSPSQRNVNDISHNTEPFMENYRGVNLYKLENLGTGTNQTINLSFSVDVYAVETEITDVSTIQGTHLIDQYTQSTNLIHADNDEIVSTVNSIIGREQNPYTKAKLLYDWIISNSQMIENALFINGDEFDSCAAVLYFTAMMRAAGIPCIPIAGILIDNYGEQTMRHYWTEFWLNGFGWIPVDIVMGAEAAPRSFLTREDSAEYFFGNLDNQRIAFSRGELNLSQMESRGRPVSHSNSYSLQNIWEEASGGLESYNSLWGDIIITGIYVQ